MIQDVEIENLQVNADEHGHLTEMWRSDWEFYAGEDEPGDPIFFETYPGIIRAWGRHHRGQIDHFVVPRGKAKIGIYDDRKATPAEGELDTYILYEGNMNYWHGFIAVSDEQMLPINFPTKNYNCQDPDEELLPYDTDQIPLDWEEHPHEYQ
jgi:dTDP-4-dehydrorhamnose 3,5-epimerase